MHKLYEIPIALFCVYHMLAIALYATPAPFSNNFSPLRPWIAPYILITSQWQGWNLFSPDPLRRVTEYGIEVKEGETWKEFAHIAPQTIRSIRRADELKYLGRIEREERLQPLRIAYLHDFCRRTEGLASQTPIRFVEHWYVLPKDADGLMRVSNGGIIPFESAITADTVCP